MRDGGDVGPTSGGAITSYKLVTDNLRWDSGDVGHTSGAITSYKLVTEKL